MCPQDLMVFAKDEIRALDVDTTHTTATRMIKMGGHIIGSGPNVEKTT